MLSPPITGTCRVHSRNHSAPFQTPSDSVTAQIIWS